MSTKVTERLLFQQEDPLQYVRAENAIGIIRSTLYQKAAEWGICPVAFEKSVHVMYEFHFKLQEQAALKISLQAKSQINLKTIQDLESQMKVENPIRGKIGMAQSKLVDFESELGVKVKELAKAREERERAASVHRAAAELRANPQKSSRAKQKVNANWHEIQRNKSHTEDLLHKAEAAHKAALRAVGDQRSRVLLLEEELAKDPSLERHIIVDRIQTLRKEIEAAAKIDRELELFIQEIRREAEQFIESFIKKNVTSPDPVLQRDLREHLKIMIEDSSY